MWLPACRDLRAHVDDRLSWWSHRSGVALAYGYRPYGRRLVWYKIQFCVIPSNQLTTSPPAPSPARRGEQAIRLPLSAPERGLGVRSFQRQLMATALTIPLDERGALSL